MHCPSRWTFEFSIRYCPNYYVIISIINERPHFFHTFAKKIFGLLHCIWKTLCIWNCERGVSPPGPINVTGFITALFCCYTARLCHIYFIFLWYEKELSLYTLNISSREARMCWITHHFLFIPPPCFRYVLQRCSERTNSMARWQAYKSLSTTLKGGQMFGSLIASKGIIKCCFLIFTLPLSLSLFCNFWFYIGSLESFSASKESLLQSTHRGSEVGGARQVGVRGLSLTLTLNLSSSPLNKHRAKKSWDVICFEDIIWHDE